MRSKLWSVIVKWSKLKKYTHMTSIYSLSVTQNWREIWISLEFEIEFVEPMAGVPWWWPSLASLTQSSWSLLSNALGGQDCIRLGPMAGVPWWWRRPRWMGDGGAWCATSLSISVLDTVLFFFLRWITLILLKLPSNYGMVEVCSCMRGISTCGESVAAALKAYLPVGCLVLWALLFSNLLVWGWVGGGGACWVHLIFFIWGTMVSSEGGATSLFLNTNPSSSLSVSLSAFRHSTVDDGCWFFLNQAPPSPIHLDRLHHQGTPAIGPNLKQSYPPRALDRRLQEDWVRDAREGPRVLMSLMVDFGPMG